MGVRILLVVLVVLVAVGGRKTDTAALTITRDNAYTGLIVAIREDLDSSKCDVYVQSIQDMIGYASEILYNATNNKLYFGEVTIVIPWSCTGINIVSNSQWLGWDDAHLRLGPQDPLFKDNPWTQQPRGCGEPGDFIYFSDGFLFSNADMEYQGKLLVHEWAKFRWGVFEEYGHMHDPIYPTAYLTSDNTFGPSYCVNAKLTGTLSDGCMQNDKDNCSFTPDLTPDSNTNVTSSLLSVPFLKTVINFCNSTDHDTTVPTKHNLLCDKHSIQEVIDQHDDMKTIPGNTLMNTNFSVVMAPPPGDTIVFVLDYSIIMQNVASRLQFLKDSVSQFIRFKAVPQTRVGLVIFADDVLISKELQLLNTDDNRNSLIQTILLNFSNKQKKNLLPGILQAVKILGNEKGVIVLVTENLEAYQPSPSLIDAAQGYQVWPILYPHDDNIPIQVYQDLADIVPGTPVLTASNIIDTVMILGNLNSYQSVDSYAALSENLLKVGGNSLEKVADGTCSEKVCSVTLAVNDGIQYESNAFIEVLYSMVEVMLVPSPSINISASSYSENLIKFELPILTSKMFAVEHPQNTSYTVDIQRKTDVTLVKAMLLATPVNVFNILVWSSQGLTNLYYTTSSVPTLFAMVMKGWHHVLYADVTAIITSKTGEMILKLHDDGVGGDVTGNDGVYSAYMVQFYPPDNVTIMVTATDNNGTARILASATDNGTAHALVSAFHSSPGTEEQACCGSQLIIPDELLENPGSFSVSSPSIIGYLTGDPPDSLLPAQITDLRSLRDNQNVTLMFTAPGDQLDLGTAAFFIVEQQGLGNSMKKSVNISASEAGSLVQYSLDLLDCDTVFSFTVTTQNTQGKKSKVSNEVHELVSCTSSTPSLSAGAIAGIVIGSLFGVLILIIIVFLCLNRDHLDDLCLWQVLTCKYIRRKKDDNSVYNSAPPNSTRNDIIRSNMLSISGPVRSISDLYSKPNLNSKRISRQKKQDEDDGGFGERRRQYENSQMNALNDSSSQRSSPYPYNSQKTLSINEVGLPPDQDYKKQNINQKAHLNYHNASLNGDNDGSYDNSAYDGYNGMNDYANKPKNIRNNTQV